ncbi:HetP family heterocyst commitment protein [Brunnivagina elsteri]|uniref:HetP family heterocyst commitment protein n=1 Tax=Brunnivagina elsteri TaxID=1247191 RepID=UPI001FE68FF5|nr:HetP family heterocyst commitment protein [Calothrix elsteri]
MMVHQTKPAQKQTDRAMKPEQFSQVVEAIASGRYSWACVLILRFAGYNPLHYIPYRTYSRLLKENRQLSSDISLSSTYPEVNNNRPSNNINNPINNPDISSCLNQINDLNYLEPLESQQINTTGGYSAIYSQADTKQNTQNSNFSILENIRTKQLNFMSYLGFKIIRDRN